MNDLDRLFGIDELTQWARDRDLQLRAAISTRDLAVAVKIVWGHEHTEAAPFVWPEVYERTYYYQRHPLYGAHFGNPAHWANLVAPVIMRGCKLTLNKKYPKGSWAIKVFERFLSAYRPTIVDRSLWNVFREFWDRRGYERRATFPLEYARSLTTFVVVAGRKIPLDRERIAQIEKGMRIVERIDALSSKVAA